MVTTRNNAKKQPESEKPKDDSPKKPNDGKEAIPVPSSSSMDVDKQQQKPKNGKDAPEDELVRSL
jgi:hypothetical protein